MYVKKSLGILLIAGTLALAVSCSSPDEKKEEVTSEAEEEKSYYSGKLSEEEMEKDHLSLELCEKVTVDADITPHSKYKDGLNYYFTRAVQREGKVDVASYQKNPYVFGKPVKQLEEMIAGTSGGKFSEDEIKVKKSSKSFSVKIPYKSNDGTKRVLSCSQDVNKKGRPGGENISFARTHTKDEKGTTAEYDEYNFGRDLLETFPDQDMSDFSFGSREEIGEELRSLLSDVMGKTLADRYVSMPVSKDNYKMLVSTNIWYSEKEIVPLDSEYYAYFFYQDLDGFPWEDVSLQWKREENEKFAKGVSAYDAGPYEVAYVARQPKEQIAVYGADGIRELWLEDNIETSGIYKEKQKICAMDDLLIHLQEYFSKDTKLPTTIYDIHLSYAEGLTEPGEGVVRGVAKPYWHVKFWKKWWDGNKCEELWVNAATGECYISGATIGVEH